MLNTYITKNKNNIISNTQALIQIPSVLEKSNNPEIPFGNNINTALEYMLNLGNKLGFKTKNIDNHCGYIEFGTGKKLIGILGHLDVVPAGDNWSYPPFSATINNGNIYGRGAIDDKGPIISSIYAMKYVKDLLESQDRKVDKFVLKKTNTHSNDLVIKTSSANQNTNSSEGKNMLSNCRVRLILGLDEESNWDSINYYKKHEEAPSISFSPDADFPCIYAEKGVYTAYLKTDYSKYFNSNIIIKQLSCDNNPINVVPKLSSATLLISNNSLNINEIITYLKTIISKANYEIDIYQINSSELKLTSHGKEAHSAHPELGINSISRLVIILNDLLVRYDSSFPLFEYFSKFINTQVDGKNLNLNIADESGSLTFNVSTLELDDDIISFGINLRTPVHTALNTIETSMKNSLLDFQNIDYEFIKFLPSLYISKDNYLVKTLSSVFNTVTASNKKYPPLAIGGATYARAFTNSISFGPNFPLSTDMCHQANEYISIDHLLLCTKIYATAILELMK